MSRPEGAKIGVFSGWSRLWLLGLLYFSFSFNPSFAQAPSKILAELLHSPAGQSFFKSKMGHRLLKALRVSRSESDDLLKLITDGEMIAARPGLQKLAVLMSSGKLARSGRALTREIRLVQGHMTRMKKMRAESGLEPLSVEHESRILDFLLERHLRSVSAYTKKLWRRPSLVYHQPRSAAHTVSDKKILQYVQGQGNVPVHSLKSVGAKRWVMPSLGKAAKAVLTPAGIRRSAQSIASRFREMSQCLRLRPTHHEASGFGKFLRDKLIFNTIQTSVTSVSMKGLSTLSEEQKSQFEDPKNWSPVTPMALLQKNMILMETGWENMPLKEISTDLLMNIVSTGITTLVIRGDHMSFKVRYLRYSFVGATRATVDGAIYYLMPVGEAKKGPDGNEENDYEDYVDLDYSEGDAAKASTRLMFNAAWTLGTSWTGPLVYLIYQGTKCLAPASKAKQLAVSMFVGAEGWASAFAYFFMRNEYLNPKFAEIDRQYGLELPVEGKETIFPESKE